MDMIETEIFAARRPHRDMEPQEGNGLRECAFNGVYKVSLPRILQTIAFLAQFFCKTTTTLIFAKDARRVVPRVTVALHLG
mmetsp:Transcript_5246/g.16965  ORF Transcript_5246/g.16965 Transcript_5246/m.16965 type:complete len:81 (-) Transcript_5246:1362-1604(-)